MEVGVFWGVCVNHQLIWKHGEYGWHQEKVGLLETRLWKTLDVRLRDVECTGDGGY